MSFVEEVVMNYREVYYSPCCPSWKQIKGPVVRPVGGLRLFLGY